MILINTPDFVNDGCEGVGVLDEEICKRFSIQVDVGRAQFMHEQAVRKPVLFDSFGNARDPEPAEIALAQFAAGKGIFTGMKIGFARNADIAAFGHAVAFVGGKQLFMFCVRSDAAFYSHTR